MIVEPSFCSRVDKCGFIKRAKVGFSAAAYTNNTRYQGTMVGFFGENFPVASYPNVKSFLFFIDAHLINTKPNSKQKIPPEWVIGIGADWRPEGWALNVPPFGRSHSYQLTTGWKRFYFFDMEVNQLAKNSPDALLKTYPLGG